MNGPLLAAGFEPGFERAKQPLGEVGLRGGSKGRSHRIRQCSRFQKVAGSDAIVFFRYGVNAKNMLARP